LSKATIRRAGEIIIDERLAERYNVDVGDTLFAGGRDWSVVGKSKGRDFVATQTVFVTLEQAQETLRMKGAATFYVIKVEEGRGQKARDRPGGAGRSG
jgi:ABC-type lipoprotein release transport system permease subunit